MLETLRHIVQEVNAAQNLTEALQIIVRRVRDAMGTQVCSVYMGDHASGHYVLRATEGLNEDQVGVASLAQAGPKTIPVSLCFYQVFYLFLDVRDASLRNQKTIFAIVNQFRNSGMPCCYDRNAHQHGFFQRIGDAFLVTAAGRDAGVQINMRLLQKADHFGVRSGAHQMNMVLNACFLEKGSQWVFEFSVADDLSIFVDPSSENFHLQSSAMEAIDQGMVVADPGLDIDGESRDIGGGPDIGADEYSP